MQIVTRTYEGHAIAYQDDGWFNATQAAAKYDKVPNELMRLPATIEYLGALEAKYGKFPHFRTKRGVGGGTWLHPRLAVHFARWLDPAFAVWCDEQIEALLRGKDDKAFLGDGGIVKDSAQWSRIMNAGQHNFPHEKLNLFMDLAENEAPLMWLVYSRGYDIASLRQRETEVERELRLAREALASERMKNKVLVEALNGRQA